MSVGLIPFDIGFCLSSSCVVVSLLQNAADSTRVAISLIKLLQHQELDIQLLGICLTVTKHSPVWQLSLLRGLSNFGSFGFCLNLYCYNACNIEAHTITHKQSSSDSQSLPSPSLLPVPSPSTPPPMDQHKQL